MLIIAIISTNFNFSLFGMFDFQKWVWMLWGCLTILTKIKIFTNWAFVTNSLKIFDSTLFASYLVNYFLFFNWNFTLNLTFDWTSNWRFLNNLFLNLFNQLRHELFQFTLNFRLSFFNLIWLFFLNNFFLFLLRDFWFIDNIDNIDEFFLFLRLIGAGLLSKFWDLIVKVDFSSLVKEFKLSFLDEDFDNFIWGLSHNFEILLIWECDLIIFIIKIRKLESFRKAFKGTMNIGFKCNQRWVFLGVVDVGFFSVCKFKKHVFLINIYNSFWLANNLILINAIKVRSAKFFN